MCFCHKCQAERHSPWHARLAARDIPAVQAGGQGRGQPIISADPSGQAQCPSGCCGVPSRGSWGNRNCSAQGLNSLCFQSYSVTEKRDCPRLLGCNGGMGPAQPGAALVEYSGRGDMQLTEVKRSRPVWLATWKGCSPWASHPVPLGTLCHPDRPPFPGPLQHFAPSPGFPLHTKPTAARGGAGCSAVLNITTAHLSAGSGGEPGIDEAGAHSLAAPATRVQFLSSTGSGLPALTPPAPSCASRTSRLFAPSLALCRFPVPSCAVKRENRRATAAIRSALGEPLLPRATRAPPIHVSPVNDKLA